MAARVGSDYFERAGRNDGRRDWRGEQRLEKAHVHFTVLLGNPVLKAAKA